MFDGSGVGVAPLARVLTGLANWPVTTTEQPIRDRPGHQGQPVGTKPVSQRGDESIGDANAGQDQHAAQACLDEAEPPGVNGKSAMMPVAAYASSTSEGRGSLPVARRAKSRLS
jgi:hypothetical protein